MRNSLAMAEETLWEQGKQLKQVQKEILELGRDMKDIPEMKSTLNQLVIADSETKSTLEHMMGMLTTLSKQIQPSRQNLEEDVEVRDNDAGHQWRGQFGGKSSNAEGIHTKILRLEFPTFSGEDPDSWCYKAEQFFDFYEIQERQKLRITAFYMEGKALSWFQALRNSNNLSSWEEFLVAIQVRFGKGAYDDLMETLSKLKQTGALEEYKT
jgi:hypothetical protein